MREDQQLAYSHLLSLKTFRTVCRQTKKLNEGLGKPRTTQREARFSCTVPRWYHQKASLWEELGIEEVKA